MTARSAAYAASAPSPLMPASASATAVTAAASASGRQRFSQPCARRIFHAGMPSCPANASGEPRPADATTPRVRRLDGESGADEHRVDAGRERPAQRLQRSGDVALDGAVGDGEPGRLRAAAVVGADVVGSRLRLPTVGDQLRAGGRQLAQVRAYRRDEIGCGVAVDRSSGRRDLVEDELLAVARGPDPHHVDDARSGAFEPFDQRLALAPPACDDDEADRVVRPGRPSSMIAAATSLAASCSSPYDDDAAVAEQRRRCQLGQLARSRASTAATS